MPKSGNKEVNLPVWIYWEGECPRWIQECQRTIFAHARDVRHVTPEEFARLRSVDTDIDLGRLDAAHRADFIRAFLLTKFGGLWVDSDCLVMQPLQPLLNLLSSNDFLFHKERSGYVSNGFIGACAGSKIAATLYDRLCQILRSGRPLGWTSLGSEPLSEIITKSTVPCYELPCELIQPICWSQPEVFFKINDAVDHERAFDEQAICYMLSNNAIQKFQATNRTRALLDDGTFFRFLANKALGEIRETDFDTVKSNVRAGWQQIPFCVEAILDVSPLQVLDVGIGFGRWGMLVREFCTGRKNGNASEEPGMRVIGIETTRSETPKHACLLYDQIHVGGALDIIEAINERWDLVIFEDYDWSANTAPDVLKKALNVSDYVLVNDPVLIESKTVNNNPRRNGHTLPLTLDDLISANLVRGGVGDGDMAKTTGALLLSHSDPRGLKRANPMQRVFEKIIESNRKVQDESLSGPGSCLAQTAEIRRLLPFLLADLNIRSLLDAPCGDFNWLKHVRLDLEEYIGGDIVPALVEQNQKQFADKQRRYLHLDITRDHLPQVDLILCRDCLVHFPLAEVTQALKNFKRSRSRYLLTTTFTGPRRNTEIATGEWRTLNLQLPPFNFPPPLRLVNEKCTEVNGMYSDKGLGLWRLDSLLL
jgi:mannosyltransferase OCH1-like enzyme